MLSALPGHPEEVTAKPRTVGQWDVWLGRVLDPSEGGGQRSRLGAVPDGTGMGTESRTVAGAVFEASGCTWVRAGENQVPGRPSSLTAGVRSPGRVEGHSARRF